MRHTFVLCKTLFPFIVLFLFACGMPPTLSAPVVAVSATLASVLLATHPPVSRAFTSAPTFTVTPSRIPTHAPTSIYTATPSSKLESYENYTIEYLRSRTYGGGALEIVEALRSEEEFTAYSTRYLSDGIYIYAIMNVPKSEGLHPVVIFIHGYAPIEEYDLFKSDLTMDDELARQGYVVIHPALRNYYPSENGDNFFRVGDSIDILNLISIVKEQGGAGALLDADPHRIGLLGHSMGGGIALRVLTISADVKAAVLYSSISGDEKLNAGFFKAFANDPQFAGETKVPTDTIKKISPASYYHLIAAPVLLVHGQSDWLIRPEWAKENCDLLRSAGVDVTCKFYKYGQHIFTGRTLELFLAYVSEYYQTYLQ